MTTRFSIRHALGLLMCALIVETASCGRTGAAAEEPTNRPDTNPVVPVTKVGRADLANDLVLTAEFEPFQQIDVMAKVAGYLRTIKVDIGDRIREGQLLATLEVP